jgi:hypothetical protein
VGVAAMRFLAGIDSNVTCVPSIMINGSERELDFVMWLRESSWSEAAPRLILGESKTHNLFEPKDIRRMREMALRFPGAVLVFATLRPKLETSEIRLLERIARWGRGLWGPEDWRHPVIVLTDLELFSIDGSPDCWRTNVALERQVDRFAYAKRLEATADLTQQLHLGMRSYAEAWNAALANWKAKRQKARQRRRGIAPMG